MSPAALLDRCRTLDINLWVDTGTLRYEAPRGALDDDLRAELAEHKAALVKLLVTASTAAPAAEPDPIDRLQGPRRTSWGTLVWSDPSEPPIESFGEPPL